MAVHYTVILLAPLVCSALGADEFNCQKLPPLTRPAATVYELRPQDIKVLMAMGDSVTAGKKKIIKKIKKRKRTYVKLCFMEIYVTKFDNILLLYLIFFTMCII